MQSKLDKKLAAGQMTIGHHYKATAALFERSNRRKNNIWQKAYKRALKFFQFTLSVAMVVGFVYGVNFI